MLERVAGIITRYSMFQSGQRVGVAVSGGADSVCLLYVLLGLAPRWDLRLSVLHLDHGLRGQESRQDAAFVRDLTARFHLPFHLAEANLKQTDDNLEQAAREARHEFFLRFLREGTLDRVALGHTRSDQAETVLFRFLRGSGSAGLAGIRPVTSDGLVRPLLDVDRSEVECYLGEHGIPWREDSTNCDLRFSRNRIRHDLLPTLTREWNPSLTETLAHTADWALAEETYWEAELDRLAAAHLVRKPPAVLLRADVLAEFPQAVARRLVRRVMESAKGDLRGIDFRHIPAVIELATATEGHGRLQVPGLDIFRSFEWLRFAPPVAKALETRNFRLPLPVPGSVPLPPGETVISTEVIENSDVTEMKDSGYNDYVGELDWERISSPLELRNWRPGDQYQPVGHTGQEKIKALFQQARIPLWERRHWPIITHREAIIWSRLFGPAAGFAATPASRAVLRIREAVV